ncbi:MAG: hypothetical protein RLZZ546_2898, partial [Bacteroidota bacterium]
IFKNGKKVSSIDINDFTITNDHFSLVCNRNIVFQKESNFMMDVAAKVRVFNLDNSKDAQLQRSNSGYKSDQEIVGGASSNKNSWPEAKLKDNTTVYVDERNLDFRTNCGIKYIEGHLVNKIDPMHRSQNNPIAKSPAFTDANFRKASDPKSHLKISANKYSLQNFYVGEGRDYRSLQIELIRDVIREEVLCLPSDYKNNTEFLLKVSSFAKSGNNGETFVRKNYATIINGNRNSAIAKLTENLPANSFCVVQLIAKRKTTPQSNNNNNSMFVVDRNITTGSDNKIFSINKRSMPLEQKLQTPSGELEFFEWYFTTGEYDTYQNKLRELEIQRDTSTGTHEIFAGANSGSVYSEIYKALKSEYTFLGKERFDYHDLNQYNFNSIFPGAAWQILKPELKEGFLGYAFDNKSQATIDSFLNVYYENNNLLNKNSGSTNKISNMMKNYITEKMSDAVKYVYNEHSSILPFLNSLPANLNYGSYTNTESQNNNEMMQKITHSGATVANLSNIKYPLFKIQRTSIIQNYLRTRERIIPSVILSLNDINKFRPGGIEYFRDLSLMSDMMKNMQNGFINQVSLGFNPSIINVINSL